MIVTLNDERVKLLVAALKELLTASKCTQAEFVQATNEIIFANGYAAGVRDMKAAQVVQA